jgi:membrane associated rhomboid family serine protease
MWERIKGKLSRGKITVKIIIIQAVIFLVLNLFSVLFSSHIIDFQLINYFQFPTELSEFLFQPWSIFSSIVSHLTLDHFFFNMLFFFFSGMMFEELFGDRKLISLFILGGLVGNLAELLATSLFPYLAPPHFVIGASGSIMAIFTAIVFYRPQTPVYLFGMVPIPIYFLALFFFAKDLIGIGSDDNTAHFAHLGGALMGFVAQLNPHNKNNILNILSNFLYFKSKKNSVRNKRFKSDEEFNAEKIINQDRIDGILDKISKSGYESLSREEKEFLFKQGKK